MENNYQILNFNGPINSLLFLSSMFLQNKWSDFSELLLKVNPSYLSIIYLIFVNLILNFLIPRLIIGFIIFYLMNKIVNIPTLKSKTEKNLYDKLG